MEQNVESQAEGFSTEHMFHESNSDTVQVRIPVELKTEVLSRCVLLSPLLTYCTF
jgi:hypothetical protein